MKSREVTLGDVCEIKQGKYLSPGQMESQPSEDAPVPVVGGNGILGFTTTSTFSFPLPLVTCRGSRCGLMQWAEPPTWISNNAMAVYFKDGLGDDFFLYQYLLQSSFDDVTTGSAQPQITVSNLSLKKMMLPELKVQQGISRLMMDIEKKIEFNTSISRNLEEIAQAIFKSWFVDFDPVKAKMAGEKPVGMDDATAALFPNSMEDSELGLIPEGWEVMTIGDVLVKQKPGKLYDQKTSSQSGLIPVLDQGRSGVVGYHNEAPGYFATPENPVVVFANHTCSLRFIAYPFSVIQNVFPILGNDLSVYWLYFALQGKQKFDSYKGHWPDLVIKPVVRPTQIVSKAFENLTSPLMKLIWNLEKENQGLIQLRDSLLPRLISGELQIPEEMLVP